MSESQTKNIIHTTTLQKSPRIPSKGNSIDSTPTFNLFKLLPKRDLDKKNRFYCIYQGTSMNPILRELDVMEIVPYGESPMKIGDVILFPHFLKEEKHVVHRVTAIKPYGVCTRGDNNPLKDPWVTSSNNIIGRVVAAWRGDKRVGISRGMSGSLTALFVYVCNRFLSFCSPLLRRVFFKLKRSNIVTTILPMPFQPRIIAFPYEFQAFCYP